MLPYRSDLIDKARRLRRDMTVPERLLWGRLRRAQLGRRFARQRPIGAYVVDFFCREATLVVELDGRSHDGREGYDRSRQAWLETQGLTVLRFSNDDVLRSADAVAARIHAWMVAQDAREG